MGNTASQDVASPPADAPTPSGSPSGPAGPSVQTSAPSPPVSQDDIKATVDSYLKFRSTAESDAAALAVIRVFFERLHMPPVVQDTNPLNDAMIPIEMAAKLRTEWRDWCECVLSVLSRLALAPGLKYAPDNAMPHLAAWTPATADRVTALLAKWESEMRADPKAVVTYRNGPYRIHILKALHERLVALEASGKVRPQAGGRPSLKDSRRATKK